MHLIVRGVLRIVRHLNISYSPSGLGKWRKRDSCLGRGVPIRANHQNTVDSDSGPVQKMADRTDVDDLHSRVDVTTTLNPYDIDQNIRTCRTHNKLRPIADVKVPVKAHGRRGGTAEEPSSKLFKMTRDYSDRSICKIKGTAFVYAVSGCAVVIERAADEMVFAGS